MTTVQDLTALIAASAAGDSSAGEQLWLAVYRELRLIARSRIAVLGGGATLDTTGLVHESYLRLAGNGLDGYVSRKHFYATAASAMRQIVIDQLRRRGADRRTPRDEALEDLLPPVVWPDELVEAAATFERLQRIDQRLAEVAELRIFVGLEMVEIAALIGQSERTVRRDWQKARALLTVILEPTGDGPGH